MATFIATLLNVESECSPEEACVPIEADTLAKAKTEAAKILKGELHGMGFGWRSYTDTKLWGKEQRVLVDVVSQDEFASRSETQTEHEARLRKAAKV